MPNDARSYLLLKPLTWHPHASAFVFDVFEAASAFKCFEAAPAHVAQCGAVRYTAAQCSAAHCSAELRTAKQCGDMWCTKVQCGVVWRGVAWCVDRCP